MSNLTEAMEPRHGPHEAVDKTAASEEALYGMITGLALIVVLEESPSGPWRVVVIIVAATCAFAFAKAYASMVAEILSKGEHLTRGTLRSAWREVRPLMVYLQLPTLVFVLSALGFLSLDLAFRVAQAVGVFSLFLAGYSMGRRVGFSCPRSRVSGLAIGVVGGMIISLRVLTHRRRSGAASRAHARSWPSSA